MSDPMKAAKAVFGDVTAVEELEDKSYIMDEFIDAFKSRIDVYAEQLPGGAYSKVEKRLTKADILKHLSGEKSIGVYLISPATSKVCLGILDFDKYDDKLIDAQKHQVRSCYLAAVELGIDKSIIIEESGGKGFHLLVISDPLPAAKMRQVLQAIVDKADLETKTGLQIEVLPKQDEIAPDGFGTVLKLPLGRHAKSGRWSMFVDEKFHKTPPLNVLTKLCKLTEVQADGIIKDYKPTLPEITKTDDKPGGILPCIADLLLGIGEGGRNEASFALVKWHRRNGLPQSLTLEAMKAWNRLNKPPLNETELERIVSSTYERNYTGIGCKSHVLASRCKDGCPVKGKVVVDENVNVPEKDHTLPTPGLDKMLPDKGWLRDYFDLMKDATDAPAVFHLTAGLCAMAGAIGNRVWIQDLARKLYLNIYLVNLAASGSGRKSTITSPVMELLDFEEVWGSDMVLSNDFSIEGLGREFAANPERILIANEFKSTLDVFKRSYNTEGISRLVDVFDFSVWTISRMREGKLEKERVRGVCLNILAASTTQWLLQALEPKDYQVGLWNRFLFCLADRDKFLAEPKWVGAELEDMRYRLVKLREGIKPDTQADLDLIKPDLEAFAHRCEDERKELGKDPKGRLLEGGITRCPLYAKKFACLYAIAEIGVPAPLPRHWHMAQTMVEFLFDCNKYIVDTELCFSDVEKRRKDVFKAILEQPGIAKSDLTRKTQHLSQRDRNQLLDELEEGKWIKRDKIETGGRPTEKLYPYSWT